MKRPHAIVSFGTRLIRGLAIVLALSLAVPSFASPPGDAQLFTDGFSAWQKKDYHGAVDSISRLLGLYPETPLRDVSLLLLARANLKAGNQQEAARVTALFLGEYPNSPLKTTIEDDLLRLVARYRKGEAIAASPGGTAGAPSPRATAAVSPQAEPASAERAAVEESIRARVATKIAAEATTDQERLAKLKAEQERVAKEKAEQEQLVKEKAEKERLAKLRAEQERIAKEKAEKERLAKLKAEQERIAEEKAEQESLGKLKAEQERIAKEKAEQERVAKEKVEQERIAKEKAEQERLAKLKAEQERIAKEKAEQERLAKLKAEQEQKEAAAARTATVALQQVASAAAVAVVPLGRATQAVDGQALHNRFDFSVEAAGGTCEAGKQISVPFEVANLGPSADTFRLESAFPAKFNARFLSTGGKSITMQTLKLAPNATFRGTLTLTVPPGSIDGEKISYPVSVVSPTTRETLQKRDVAFIATAPLVRVVARPLKREAAPGEEVTYRITAINAGSVAANRIVVRLEIPPQYEVAENRDFRRDGSGYISSMLRIESGGYQELSVTLRLKKNAEPGSETVLSGEILNWSLNTKEKFRSVAVKTVAK